ncbi:hypothetical protein V6N13_116143 [Hibiscus sabdariffa]
MITQVGLFSNHTSIRVQSTSPHLGSLNRAASSQTQQLVAIWLRVTNSSGGNTLGRAKVAFNGGSKNNRNGESLVKVMATQGKPTEEMVTRAKDNDGTKSTKESKVSKRSNHCNWVGITCNSAGSATDLSLAEYGSRLRVTLCDLDFLSFHNLTRLHLPNNSLYGPSPSHIRYLSKLIFLNLSFNNLSGNIPFEICLLTRLQLFSLESNKINGPMPPNIGNMTSVSGIYFSDNYLSGPIPASVGNFRNWIWLDLYGNYLSGSIPNEIGLLESLFVLHLLGNNLTGAIPISIANLTNLAVLWPHSSNVHQYYCFAIITQWPQWSVTGEFMPQRSTHSSQGDQQQFVQSDAIEFEKLQKLNQS